MTDRHSFAYESCVVPEGMTLTEWRKARSVPRVRLWARFRGWLR